MIKNPRTRGGYSPARGLQNTNPQWVVAPVESKTNSAGLWVCPVCLSFRETDFTRNIFYKLKSLRVTKNITSYCEFLCFRSGVVRVKKVRLIQTCNQGRLCTTRRYNFKNKANERVGTAARFCACESRTVAQKPARSRQVLRKANPKFLVACLVPTANAELALNTHIALNASHATLPILCTWFWPKPDLLILSQSSQFLQNATFQIRYKIQIKFSNSYPGCAIQHSTSHLFPSGNN